MELVVYYAVPDRRHILFSEDMKKVFLFNLNE